MTVDIRIATLADRPAWDAIHAASGIPSHGWPYAEALSHSGIDPRLAIVSGAGGRLVIPFFERTWQGTTDVCTWLSVSGARLEPPFRPLLDAWCAYGRSRSWVAGYLQVEPESEVADIEEARAGNEVFLVDLSTSGPLPSARLRRKIRRASRSGTELVEDRALLAEALVRLYPATMARLGASAAYQLSDRSLRHMAGAPSNLVLGAAGDGELQAVIVVPIEGGRAEFFLNASTVPGRDLSGWLLWQAMEHLRDAGVRSLNLGGGVRPGDGLYEFKSWFGGRVRALHSLSQIYDPDTYAALCRRAGASAGEAWFPAYRAAQPKPARG
jgi:hypothetical protein